MRIKRERPVLFTVPCTVMASSPTARPTPRNVLSLRAGLPVLNIVATSLAIIPCAAPDERFDAAAGKIVVCPLHHDAALRLDARRLGGHGRPALPLPDLPSLHVRGGSRRDGRGRARPRLPRHREHSGLGAAPGPLPRLRAALRERPRVLAAPFDPRRPDAHPPHPV